MRWQQKGQQIMLKLKHITLLSLTFFPLFVHLFEAALCERLVPIAVERGALADLRIQALREHFHHVAVRHEQIYHRARRHGP